MNDSKKRYIKECYLIVKAIDCLIEPTIKICRNRTTFPKEYDCLNKSFYNNVKIIPLFKDTLLSKTVHKKLLDTDEKEALRKKRDNYLPGSELNKNLCNYFVMYGEEIDKYPVKFVYLSEHSSIANHLKGKSKICFQIEPFSNEEIENILEIKFTDNTFYIDKFKEDKHRKLQDRYNKIYKNSLEKNVDFLIFPEMLISKEMINGIKDMQNENGPKIIINGSIWENGKNTSIITNSSGESIFSYNKRAKYIYKEKYLEKLKMDDKDFFYFLDIAGFGRISVCICCDLIDTTVILFQKLMQTELLFVPAFTPSADMQSSAEDLAKNSYRMFLLVLYVYTKTSLLIVQHMVQYRKGGKNYGTCFCE